MSDTLEDRMTRVEADMVDLRAMAERIVLLLRGTAGVTLELFNPPDDEAADHNRERSVSCPT